VAAMTAGTCRGLARRRHPPLDDDVLERQRDACEGAERLAGGTAGVDLIGLGAGAVGVDVEERPHRRVDLGDAGKVRLGHFPGAEVAGGDPRGEGERVGAGGVLDAHRVAHRADRLTAPRRGCVGRGTGRPPPFSPPRR